MCWVVLSLADTPFVAPFEDGAMRSGRPLPRDRGRSTVGLCVSVVRWCVVGCFVEQRSIQVGSTWCGSMWCGSTRCAATRLLSQPCLWRHCVRLNRLRLDRGSRSTCSATWRAGVPCKTLCTVFCYSILSVVALRGMVNLAVSSATAHCGCGSQALSPEARRRAAIEGHSTY